MQKYTRPPKNMRSCIGWPPRSSANWNLNEKKFPQNLIKTTSSLARLSSRTRTKKRRMLGMMVSTLFPQDQNALDVKVSNTWNKSALHISRPLGKARHLLLLWLQQWGWWNPKCLHCHYNPTKGIVEDVDEEEDLMESKIYKMDE